MNTCSGLAGADHHEQNRYAGREEDRPERPHSGILRDLERRACEDWTREQTRRVVGGIERWIELAEVNLPLVSFRATFVFPGGEELTSDSALLFRSRAQVEADLSASGYELQEVRIAVVYVAVIRMAPASRVKMISSSYSVKSSRPSADPAASCVTV